VCGSVRQCAAVCCSVLHCIAVCCSVLQNVAVSCSVLQCASCNTNESHTLFTRSVLQCVAVCYTLFTRASVVPHDVPAILQYVLQCVAVCCSVLQCVALNPLGFRVYGVGFRFDGSYFAMKCLRRLVSGFRCWVLRFRSLGCKVQNKSLEHI